MTTLQELLKLHRQHATDYPELRYPLVYYRIDTMYGIFVAETFVRDPKSNFITLVRDEYKGKFKLWSEIEKCKESFLNKCKLTEEMFIFNENTAIPDPTTTK